MLITNLNFMEYCKLNDRTKPFILKRPRIILSTTKNTIVTLKLD